MNPVAVNFVPFSVVAVNPQPLPSTALLQFNPLPDLRGIQSASGSFQNPVQILGHFQQTLVSPTSAGPAARLDVEYSLQGSVTGNVIPPTASQPGVLNATFNLTGTLTEFLYLSATAQQPAWTISTKLTEQGGVTGPLTVPAAGTVDIMTFDSKTDLKQSEIRPASTATGINLWSILATIQSSGKFQVSTVPPATSTVPFSVTTPFTLQDQITESLTPVSPTAIPPQPAIRVSAIDNATGSVTLTVYPVASPINPSPVFGTTQYRSQLTETIVIPPGPTNPGSTQTISETFDTVGKFQEFGIGPVAEQPDLAAPVMVD